jgi:ABC-2 type transport system ATP-binding protein
VQDVCDRITILFRGKMQPLSTDAAGQPVLVAPVKDVLQVRDVTQIESTGLTPQQIAEVQEFVRKMGTGNATVTHPTTTLEDLFMRIVREKTTPGGSYTSSDS